MFVRYAAFPIHSQDDFGGLLVLDHRVECQRDPKPPPLDDGQRRLLSFDDGCSLPTGEIQRARHPEWLENLLWHPSIREAVLHTFSLTTPYQFQQIDDQYRGLWLILQLRLWDTSVSRLRGTGVLRDVAPPPGIFQPHPLRNSAGGPSHAWIEGLLYLGDLLGSHTRHDDPLKAGSLSKHIIEPWPTTEETTIDEINYEGWALVPINSPVMSMDLCQACHQQVRCFHGHCQGCWNSLALPTPPFTSRGSSHTAIRGYISCPGGYGSRPDWMQLREESQDPWQTSAGIQNIKEVNCDVGIKPNEAASVRGDLAEATSCLS